MVKLCKYIATRLANDPFGKELGIEYSDDEMGASTYNYGIFKYDPVEKVGVVKTDCRHPKNFDLVSKLEKLQEENINIVVTSTKEAHYVPKDDELVTTLVDVYRKHTGDTKNDAFVLGGGTYARCLKKGVAFGLLFQVNKIQCIKLMNSQKLKIYYQQLQYMLKVYTKLCCE